MRRLERYCPLLCWLVLTGSFVVAQQAARVNCERAAPPRGTHYVCDDLQNPCHCRLERNDPNTPPGDFAKDVTPRSRQVWVDPRRKAYYCSEKKPAKLPKHYLRLTEEDARRQGYKPASKAGCEQVQEGHE